MLYQHAIPGTPCYKKIIQYARPQDIILLIRKLQEQKKVKGKKSNSTKRLTQQFKNNLVRQQVNLRKEYPLFTQEFKQDNQWFSDVEDDDLRKTLGKSVKKLMKR